MKQLKNIFTIGLLLTIIESNSQNYIKTQTEYLKETLKLSSKNNTINIDKKLLDIKKYATYKKTIDQEKLSTLGLLGYEVPTLYTDPKIFANKKCGIAAFAEWYVDDEEGYPLGTPKNIQDKLNKEYFDKYGEKKYHYTIYNGIYLDHYVNDKFTLSLQTDMYPYSPKIYFPDHFGAWLYFTYNF